MREISHLACINSGNFHEMSEQTHFECDIPVDRNRNPDRVSFFYVNVMASFRSTQFPAFLLK